MKISYPLSLFHCKMLTLNASPPSSLSVVPFDGSYQVSPQFLVPANLNCWFTRASRKFKTFQLKTGFWESMKTGYLQ